MTQLQVLRPQQRVRRYSDISRVRLSWGNRGWNQDIIISWRRSSRTQKQHQERNSITGNYRFRSPNASHTYDGGAPDQRPAEPERGKGEIRPSSRKKYLLLPSRSHGLDVLSLLKINPGGREPSLSCGSNYEAIPISHLWCMKTPLWLD